MPSVVGFSDDPLPSRSLDGFGRQYVHSSNEVLHFKLVRRPEDLTDDTKTFPPSMTHQIFGPEEEIFGYSKVNIQLFFTASKLKVFLKIHTEGSIKDLPGFSSEEPQDIEKPLREILPTEICGNVDDFIKMLGDESDFQPFGHQVHSFTRKGGEATYEVYRCDMMNSPSFRPFHERLQTFLMFFVDGASYIDADDDKWQYFVIYEKYKADGDGSWRYAVVGYSTVYEYYAYPDKKRPRISQFLVLPPFQRQGLGTELLKSIYRYYQGCPSVIDITVEDPSDEFQILRYYVDATLCRELTAFQNDKLREGFSEAMVKEANEKYKLNAKHTRKVYEILRLGATNVNDDEDMRTYRLDLKKRLFLGNRMGMRALKFSSSNTHKDIRELFKAECDPKVTRLQLKELYDAIYPVYSDIWKKVETTINGE